ncbi:MAG: hypothetical protein KDC43_09035 [Saprospiraceae bacterium]|nr:hypothetical protein [Saprospiraceae bacterium]
MEKRAVRYVLLILSIAIGTRSQGQDYPKALRDFEVFYGLGWLPELEDSIFIMVEESEMPEGKEYFVLRKNKGTRYDLFGWSGKKGLESPAVWEDQLKIGFHLHHVRFKFRRARVSYLIHQQGNAKFLLTKISRSKSRRLCRAWEN